MLDIRHRELRLSHKFQLIVFSLCRQWRVSVSQRHAITFFLYFVCFVNIISHKILAEHWLLKWAWGMSLKMTAKATWQTAEHRESRTHLWRVSQKTLPFQKDLRMRVSWRRKLHFRSLRVDLVQNSARSKDSEPPFSVFSYRQGKQSHCARWFILLRRPFSPNGKGSKANAGATITNWYLTCTFFHSVDKQRCSDLIAN